MFARGAFLSLILLFPLAALDTPSEMLNRGLPPWLRLSFDHRFRFEGYSALRYRPDNDDRWLLNRFRIDVSIKPTSWLNVGLQAQDARIFFKLNPAGQEPLTNRTDLRLAFVDFHLPKATGLHLRLGRQELSYGENRILGPANWGSVARSFDAVKLTFTRGNFTIDLTTASVVRPRQRGVSRSLPGNNLHYAYATWKLPALKLNLEPYFLWRIGLGDGDALRGILHQDRRIPGFRLYGQLPASFDYVTEWAFQRGNVNTSPFSQSVRAYAQHSRLRRSFSQLPWRPILYGEYDSASGDRDPNDRIASTFNQVFPTPHEKYGLADQVGWQNIHHVAGGAELQPASFALLRLSFHNWHLAQARDGVYLATGPLVYRDPTGRSGRHVGREFDVYAEFTRKPHYLGLGYARLFPGEFLRNVSPGVGLQYVFLNVGYRF